MDFEIAEVFGKGKVMIATRDILPGKVIIDKETPVMFISREYAAWYGKEKVEDCLILAGFSIYNKYLSVTAKKKFDALYGPTEGPHANDLRKVALTVKYAAEDDSELLHLSRKQVETFVRVAATVSRNIFGVSSGGFVVMDNITRMSHSCLPNCHIDLTASSASCRTILAVKKGEELTIEYSPEHRLKPTHFRRHRYLERKDFTCHCPRCDAEADDTREFDCHDPQCPGSHFACQPINKEPLGLPGLQYTGVEYVEPHLLPCTVCHSAAPLKYQLDMFALEPQLPELFENIERVRKETSPSIQGTVAQLRRIDNLKVPRRHSLSVSLLRTRYLLSIDCAVLSPGEYATKALFDIQEYLNLHERIVRFPNDPTSESYCAVLALRRCGEVFPLAAIQEWGQKGLRMNLVRWGREGRTSERAHDAQLSEVIQSLPPPPASAHTTDCAECMFCGESPLRAALTLSRCSRCRQVAYCSVGCQKAHWPVHKKGCKKTA